MASAVTEKIKEKRNRVFLGPLPTDFLRISESVQQQQEAADRQAAIALQQQMTPAQPNVSNLVGRLSVTVAQAKLAKNYGMTRMDPYARIRIAHCVYETHTDPNGGKNPRWNKVMQCLLPGGVNTMWVEIYDERSFTMDELIAWTQITIPKQVMSGETHEDWYPLSGKQGEGVEGMINLVMTYLGALQGAPQPYLYTQPSPLMVLPNASGPPGLFQLNSAPPPVAPQQQTITLSLAELKQIVEMFPNIDKEVVKTVFEANRGNREGTINALLQMGE